MYSIQRYFLFPASPKNKGSFFLVTWRKLHFERSEKSFLHSALSCFLRKSFPLFHYHTYGAIPVCQKDPSTPLGMTLRGIALSKHIRCTLREINPFPQSSFRAQREIFLALCSFLLRSQKVSPFPLSHIRRYTDVQERSLHFGRDDNENGALLSLFSCRHAKECLFEAH